jgi:hypothetical protein
MRSSLWTNFIFLLAVIILTSCSSIRKSVTKDRSVVEVVDKTVTVEEVTKTEVIDTVVVIPGDSASFITQTDVIGGHTAVVFEDEVHRVEMRLDMAKKRLYTKVVTKPKLVSVEKVVTTVTEREIRSDVKVKTEHSSVDKDVKKLRWHWWVVGLILIAAGLLLYCLFNPGGLRFLLAGFRRKKKDVD